MVKAVIYILKVTLFVLKASVLLLIIILFYNFEAYNEQVMPKTIYTRYNVYTLYKWSLVIPIKYYYHGSNESVTLFTDNKLL